MFLSFLSTFFSLYLSATSWQCSRSFFPPTSNTLLYQHVPIEQNNISVTFENLIMFKPTVSSRTNQQNCPVRPSLHNTQEALQLAVLLTVCQTELFIPPRRHASFSRCFAAFLAFGYRPDGLPPRHDTISTLAHPSADRACRSARSTALHGGWPLPPTPQRTALRPSKTTQERSTETIRRFHES